MASRSYPTGVVEALIALSHRTCYYPGCGVPVIVVVDRRPRMNLDIAHIEALNPDGPRYREGMDVKERNAFDNLLLLCRPHHKHIDDDVVAFPVALLASWKARVEVEIDATELGVFRGIDEDKFEEVIGSAIGQYASEVREALDGLKKKGDEHSGLLHKVLGRLDNNQLAGGYIDADQVTMLNEAARMLGRNLNEDNVGVVHDAARMMRSSLNEENVVGLHQAITALRSLGNLADTATALQAAARSPLLANLPDTVARLERAVRRLPEY